MTDIVERLRKLAEDLIALDLDMRLPPGSLNPHFAADEIERIRAGYERLARHIAPDVEAEYIWSHLPEQIIDAGLQIQESALSEARATGRREGLSEAAKIAQHVDLFDGDKLKNSDPRETCASAIRAAMEKAAGDPPVETKDIGERHGDHH